MPNCRGMAPESSLLTRSKRSRPVRAPSSGGIWPESKRFSSRSSTTRSRDPSTVTPSHCSMGTLADQFSCTSPARVSRCAEERLAVLDQQRVISGVGYGAAVGAGESLCFCIGGGDTTGQERQQAQRGQSELQGQRARTMFSLKTMQIQIPQERLYTVQTGSSSSVSHNSMNFASPRQ